MNTSHSFTSLAQNFINFRFIFSNLISHEKHFLLLISSLFFIAGAAYLYPSIAMWVFIGLLTSRELAIRSFRNDHDRSTGSTFHLIGKDLLFALIGLDANKPAIFVEVFN